MCHFLRYILFDSPLNINMEVILNGKYRYDRNYYLKYSVQIIIALKINQFYYYLMFMFLILFIPF